MFLIMVGVLTVYFMAIFLVDIIELVDDIGRLGRVVIKELWVKKGSK